MSVEDLDTKPALPLGVPPEPVGSPTTMPHEVEMWWRPGWRDSIKHLGWRWVLALPAAAVGALVLLAFFVDTRALTPLWMAGWKMVVLILAVPVVLMLELMRSAVQARKDPFCIHCGYGLTGLPDHHACPECGRPYTFAIIHEYRRDPHWFIRRYRMRGGIPAADAPFAAGVIRSRKSRDGT